MKQPPGEDKIIYPLGRGRTQAMGLDRFPLSLLTIPGAALYELASQRVRGRGLQERDSSPGDIVVVAIGNIEVGGNGKTPFALYLIDSLVASGHHPVYVSRGFRSEAEKMPVVTVVARGEGSNETGIRWVHGDSPGLSRVIGDEGAMIAARFPEIPLVFSSDKRPAVRIARDILGATHVVLDDAFQSWKVHRDVDVVLLDAVSPFGNGRLLPAGTLREAPSALGRADVIGLNGYDTEEQLTGFAATVEKLTGREIPVFGLRRQLQFLDIGADSPVPDAAVSLSSIARPEGFDRALAARGVEIVASVRYPDHHRYSRGDIDHVDRITRRVGCGCVVATEKDWAKLRDMTLPFERTVVARLGLEIDGCDVARIIERPRTRSAAAS